jgi:antibiotic biosynthesis monooxygenase (ABM) superfamily enzyme
MILKHADRCGLQDVMLLPKVLSVLMLTYYVITKTSGSDGLALVVHGVRT